MCHRSEWPTVERDRGRTAEPINRQEKSMKRYVIEREIPGASELSEAQLAEIAAKSNDVVASLGVPYRWITRYAPGDNISCAHEAEDEEAIREHARRGGFPANAVPVVANEFGPHTAQQTVAGRGRGRGGA